MAAFPLLRGALLSAALASALTAQNCTATSTGLVPLSDLGTGTYMGFAGGLYGGGENVPHAAHAAGGRAAVAAIEPLDATGSPSADGRIVLISIGMSNTTQEFSTWVQMSNADPNRSGRGHGGRRRPGRPGCAQNRRPECRLLESRVAAPGQRRRQRAAGAGRLAEAGGGQADPAIP